jgi:phosphoglycerate dehydrogenase-like enzyme
MAERRVVLTSGTAAKASERFSRLGELGFDVTNRFDVSPRDAGWLTAALRGAWAVVADSSDRFDRSTLDGLPDLRVIARTGVGYDAIDVAGATERGVLVFITPGTLTETVADFTLALMLASLRDVARLDASVRAGRWNAGHLGRDLHGATVVVVGLGAIGQAVARRLGGFSCRLIGVDPVVSSAVAEGLGVRLTTLADALPLADVLTLHVSLSSATRGLIGARELALLRPSAIVVNTSRGAVIDEEALVDALRSGRIAGAALDVFEQEPLPAGHALTSLENVVLTGHAASSSHAAVIRMCDAVVTGLLAAAAGNVPMGCLNPEVVLPRG